MYIKKLSDADKANLKARYIKIKELQNNDICFGCYNFEHGDVFPDEGLIIFEDNLIRCQFEKYPRATGQIIIVSKEHYEDISEMPLELGTYILKMTNRIIELQKELINAEKVYFCTICDGKRNHLHFQLLPRLKGEVGGYGHFTKEEGILMDYKEIAEMFRERLSDFK
jgi:diadenosine tetraphosphate (Ap4A) HIT family hydrolase